MAKYLDRDIASFQAGILLSIGLAILALLLSIGFISNGWPITGIFIGGIFGAAIFAGWQNIVAWMQMRYYIAAFKSQTRDLFIFSNGESEETEDDDTVIERAKFALTMLRTVRNPHGVTVWICLYRDTHVFAYRTGADGSIVETIKESRELLVAGNSERERKFGERLQVRESRKQYRDFCTRFRAEKEQEQLEKRRGISTADEWVNRHWFNQNIEQ